MAVLVPGHHGNPATMMTARAPSAAVCVGPARVTDLWPDVVGCSVRARLSRWQTVPGTVSLCRYSLCQPLTLEINQTE